MPRPKFPSDKQDQFMVRLPNGMRDNLKTEAEKNKRSMNAEIVHRLEWSLAFNEEEFGRYIDRHEELAKEAKWLETRAAAAEASVNALKMQLAELRKNEGMTDEEQTAEETNVGYLVFPEGVSDKDFERALVRANRKAFTMALRDLGITRRPIPLDDTDEEK